ncbi:MAG: ABC transporter ATP-binding protein [Pseudomonadota bacterium]
MGLRVVSTPAPPAPAVSVRLPGLSLGGAEILGEIAFDVAPGETLVLVGPSGIGKSTLLRVIAGLETPGAGRIDRPEAVSMVFQEPVLLPWRTVLQNVTLPTGVAEGAAMARLAEVGLAEKAMDWPGTLSLGQQRRLSLARAFAADPTLLLMDEPFVSLDPNLADGMMKLFARLRETYGVTTILVTHSEAEAAKLGDRILTLGGLPARITGEQVVEGRSGRRRVAPSPAGGAGAGS